MHTPAKRWKGRGGHWGGHGWEQQPTEGHLLPTFSISPMQGEGCTGGRSRHSAAPSAGVCPRQKGGETAEEQLSAAQPSWPFPGQAEAIYSLHIQDTSTAELPLCCYRCRLHCWDSDAPVWADDKKPRLSISARLHRELAQLNPSCCRAPTPRWLPRFRRTCPPRLVWHAGPHASTHPDPLPTPLCLDALSFPQTPRQLLAGAALPQEEEGRAQLRAQGSEEATLSELGLAVPCVHTDFCCLPQTCLDFSSKLLRGREVTFPQITAEEHTLLSVLI